MGTTGCHFTSIVSAAATQRQIVLYNDVNYTSTTNLPRSAVSGKSYYLQSAL